jgi:hypothetical protein
MDNPWVAHMISETQGQCNEKGDMGVRDGMNRVHYIAMKSPGDAACYSKVKSEAE